MTFPWDRIILDLCGGTGAWSRPYYEAGYDVRIITLPNQDVRVDVTTDQWPDKPVHGILAAPPCTHLCSAGARWWTEKGREALLEALSIVDACLRIVTVCKPNWWCLENPVGRLSRYLGPPKETFNPCDYGDPWTKKTCLWGDFIMPEREPIEPTHRGPEHWRPDGAYTPKALKEAIETVNAPTRSDIRSVTPPNFARAFFEANP